MLISTDSENNIGGGDLVPRPSPHRKRLDFIHGSIEEDAQGWRNVEDTEPSPVAAGQAVATSETVRSLRRTTDKGTLKPRPREDRTNQIDPPPSYAPSAWDSYDNSSRNIRGRRSRQGHVPSK